MVTGTGRETPAGRETRAGTETPVGTKTQTGRVTAWEVAAATPDPELPVVSVGELGMVRDVEETGGAVTVTLTPTYSGCPALPLIAADVRRRLAAAGYAEARVRVALAPAWTTDWITDEGRRKLAAAGIAPPGPVREQAIDGPVPLTLLSSRPDAPAVGCPRCGSARTERTARFGSTACKALYRCGACGEPFEHVKEI
jgi:ring-1,2-phenylacetyl-CoA epoxidase subunit PaaD